MRGNDEFGQQMLMNIRTLILGAALSALPASGAAQVSGLQTSEGCINLADVHARVTVEGKLAVGTFTDEDYPPEKAFVVELPNGACIDDGGDFANPAERFNKVHLSATEDALLKRLKQAVGHKVRVTGEGFAAHTRHHRAPLVVLIDNIVVK